MERLPQILLHNVVVVAEEYYMGFGVLLKVVVGEFIVVFRHESICAHLKMTETENT